MPGTIPAGIVGLIPHLQSAGLVPALVPRPEWANRTGPYRYSQMNLVREETVALKISKVHI